MAKARPIPELTAETRYADAAATAVSVRAAEVTKHAEGVLDTGDIERVHDMRVATRRLRAALEIFEPCFPAKPYRRALREVKDLADVLGERRDRDVAIAALESYGEGATADRPGVDSLIEALRFEQERANDELGPLVEAKRLRALEGQLVELADSAVTATT